MALPSPFNTVEELIVWSGFEQSDARGKDAVLQGSFPFEQFQTALKEARREIYRKTRQKQNDEFNEDRADELKEAERYLATARLYPNFGARMQLKFPESNISSIASVMNGADSPDPYTKGRQLVEFMYQKIRAIGLELLNSPSNCWAVGLTKYPETNNPYPCLSGI